MAYQNALSAYKETRVRTASPGKIVVMLYDEAIKQLDRGQELLHQYHSATKKDPSKIEHINKAIIKARDIITELMVSLDFEQGGEIARNLFSLYTWFNRELLEANLAKDEERVRAVRDMMNELRGAWQEIVSKAETEGLGRSTTGINIAG
ncbi:MAG TPA: flagellar export chaperone FliS [Termitinemataceae bacterium]|uniref:flagellar export chaperone FliS n=1 Tax=Treponema sp. J25 TaxID=2094121 RepID=UPI00104358B8|nr:flagellar export chaperone FliS [Treponema sp. J25]TCW60977.1 flagellar export chaperone FliS [Treponema sp. J25]HOJ99937.1 flagellar export chaperone FliS [Termitinemataceae bacterium]HOM23993.1 flagellar export chaperone FliS [Termitinemataceae bacterium]HPQ01066.1 flagellar export chaperone FliS [Termitinemataceae bacterium]